MLPQALITITVNSIGDAEVEDYMFLDPDLEAYVGDDLIDWIFHSTGSPIPSEGKYLIAARWIGSGEELECDWYYAKIVEVKY